MSEEFEKIEELKKRANISYANAKEILEKHNWNVLEALIELEKDKKINSSKDDTILNKIKRLVVKGNRTKFVVTKKEQTVVNLPINFMIVAVIMGFHLILLALVLVFITGCKMSIKKAEGDTIDIDDVIIDVSKKVKKAAKNFTDDKDQKVDILKKDEDKKNINIDKDKDGYNEFTVE
jgi:hypothetical protein